MQCSAGGCRACQNRSKLLDAIPTLVQVRGLVAAVALAWFPPFDLQNETSKDKDYQI